MLRLPAGSRAFAARIAVRAGSTFNTIPGPPPYGRSSTVRCTSVANSRGVVACTATRPASIARPNTPTPTAWATNSGNSVTTSIRMSSPVRGPVEHDAPGVQIDRDDSLLDERHPVLALAADHDDRPGRRRAKFLDASQRFACAAECLQSLEIAPVVLAGRRCRQLLASYCDLRPGIEPRILRAIDSGELGEHALRRDSAVFDLYLTPLTGPSELPAAIAENVLRRIGIGLNPDPALDPERPADLAQDDAPAHAACRGGFQAAAACLRGVLTRAAT